MKVFRGYGIYLFSLSLFWAFWLQLTAGPKVQPGESQETPWFLSKESSYPFTQFTILDTRSSIQRWKNKVPGSKVITWEELSRTDIPHKGELLELKLVRKKINDLGIKLNDSILVLGDGASGWGEEGRIVWSLREAGFTQAYWLDGGFETYEKEIRKKTNLKSENNINLTPKPSKPNSNSSYAIQKEELVKGLSSKAYQILDTREPREFSGATPYGEVRGGISLSKVSILPRVIRCKRPNQIEGRGGTLFKTFGNPKRKTGRCLLHRRGSIRFCRWNSSHLWL